MHDKTASAHLHIKLGNVTVCALIFRSRDTCVRVLQPSRHACLFVVCTFAGINYSSVIYAYTLIMLFGGKYALHEGCTVDCLPASRRNAFPLTDRDIFITSHMCHKSHCEVVHAVHACVHKQARPTCSGVWYSVLDTETTCWVVTERVPDRSDLSLRAIPWSRLFDARCGSVSVLCGLFLYKRFSWLHIPMHASVPMISWFSPKSAAFPAKPDFPLPNFAGVTGTTLCSPCNDPTFSCLSLVHTMFSPSFEHSPSKSWLTLTSPTAPDPFPIDISRLEPAMLSREASSCFGFLYGLNCLACSARLVVFVPSCTTQSCFLMFLKLSCLTDLEADQMLPISANVSFIPQEPSMVRMIHGLAGQPELFSDVPENFMLDRP